MESAATSDPPPGIVNMVQAPPKHRSIREDYFTKRPKHRSWSWTIREDLHMNAATALGLLHMVCGIAILTVSVTTGDLFSPMAVIPVSFLISGGLAIGGARKGNKCLVVATLVMSILSAITACFALFGASLWLYYYYYSEAIYQAPVITLAAVTAIMMVISITSSVLTCLPLCCPRVHDSGTIFCSPTGTTNNTNSTNTIPKVVIED